MLVIAHRTCPLDAPENSLAGIDVAAAAGADGVEVDVRLTHDGVPVLMHDPLPLRTTNAVLPLPLSWRQSPAVAKLHLHESGEPPPRFDQAVDHLPLDMRIAVDVKDGTAMATAIAVLERSGRLGDALLWSSHPDAVTTAAERAPAAPRAWLKNTTDPDAAAAYCQEAATLGATAVSVMDVSLTPAVVAAGHDLGLTVFSWVRTLDVQEQVIAARPDGVVTDHPTEARASIVALD